MDSGGCLSNQTLAEPMNVELSMWHQVGMAHRSIFAAAWKIFRLENTLAVCEGRVVPLDAVPGFVFSSWASSFCQMTQILRTVSASFYASFRLFFTNFRKLIRGETPRITVGCLLTPFAGCVPDCGVGGRVSLSDAWVTGCASPYYPVDNRVVAVRSTSVMLPPFCKLSIIAAAKVSHFEILCRVHDFVLTVGNLLCDFLATHTAPFQKFSKPFLCFVGINHYYEFDDDVYLVFLTDDDEGGLLYPTKVRIGERQIKEGQTPLLEYTRGRIVPLASVNDQENQDGGAQAVGNQNDDVQDAGHDVNEEGATDGQENPVEAGIVRIEDEVPATVADKPKLREDHDTFGDAGANTARKYLAVLQDLLESSTLTAEVGVTVAITIPFVTSFVTPTPESECGSRTDSISRPNLRTQRPAKRFVISLDSPHYSSANAADDEVTSIVRSSVPPPPVLTATVAATAIIGATSALAHASDVAGPSQPAGAENVINDFALDNPKVFRSMVDQLAPPGSFSQLRDMDYDQLFTEFNVGVARQACFSAEVRLRSEHNYQERKKFERRCQRQTDLLKEKHDKIASLKSQLSLKEAEAAEAIRLRGQVATVEAAETSRTNELIGLKERYSALEEEKNVLEKKDVLSVKASSLEAERDRLIDQVSLLEDTCSGLRDVVSGYKLFKEQIEVVQDEKVKVLSDRVVGLEAELMGMALPLDKEFYPCFLTTIAGRGLADVAAYNPSAKTNHISAVNALRAIDFHLLAQLASHKDASIAKIIVGEASTSGVPAVVAATTALSTTFVLASSIPPMPVSAYDVEPYVEVPSYSIIVFEKEELETTPERPRLVKPIIAVVVS
ncbi:hypothetical protein Tco_1456510 [Tanacetum coccineum]